jgi:hypothetical protein
MSTKCFSFFFFTVQSSQRQRLIRLDREEKEKITLRGKVIQWTVPLIIKYIIVRIGTVQE